MAVITLLSDFVDGTSMALVEDTDLGNLNVYMTQSQGRLWAGVQQRRRKQGLTTIRRGPGTLYFAPNETASVAVEQYLQSATGSPEEKAAYLAMTKAGVSIAPHVGAEAERMALLDGQLRDLRPQAKAQGFS